MTTLDILILIIIGIGTILGLMKGFVHQLSSLIGLIVGLLVARALFAEVGEWLAPALGTSVTVARVFAFFMIWVVVPLLFSLIASFLTRALRVIHLGWLNRLLGGALGAVKSMLIVGLFIHLLQFIDTDNHLILQTTKEESVLYYPMHNLSGMFIPAIKQVTERILRNENILGMLCLQE